MIRQMKRAFTYKDLSLIAGVAVALIIVFTLWVKQTPERPTQKASLIDRTLAEVIG